MPGSGTLVDALAGSDNAPALFCAGGGPRVTRQHLRKQIHLVASSLKAAGVKAGDAVSISDTNTVSLRCTGPLHKQHEDRDDAPCSMFMVAGKAAVYHQLCISPAGL